MTPNAATRPRYADRRASLRALLIDEGLDALLVTDLLNIRYLTGFTGSNAALLLVAADEVEDPAAHPAAHPPPADGTRFCTDFRYLVQSADEVPDLPRLIGRPCDTALLAGAATGGVRRTVGFEAHVVTVDGADALTDAAGEAHLAPTRGLVEGLRAIKDAGEIDALRRACEIGDRALAELIAGGGIRAGRSERDVALDLDQQMRLLGSRDVSFDTIVAAGANSAIPHHQPTGKVLAAGDLVKLDFGAVVDGYHSDMTRTFVLGRPAGWQQEIYELVRAAQAAGRTALRPGVECSRVDAAAREPIAAAGFGESFGHGLGHGVGLQVHEAPSLAAAATGIIAPNMVVTVEPGIYLPGRGGVRIEDCGVIESGGYVPLSLTTRDLTAL